MPQIQDLKQIQLFTSELPADPILENRVRQVGNAAFSFVNPTQPADPKLIHVSKEMMDELEIEYASTEDFLKIISGAANFPDANPFAMCYGGHQFGHWAGQLGDGRAINIAEIETSNGNQWSLQLKGSGRTPYSRGADGLAVLRSSIREYLMSEAMFHLGVPTTRALSVALSGSDVLRDVLYNGNAAYEKGAIVCRVAPSFIRFGNFEIFAAREDHENLKALTDFTIRHYYPHLGEPSKSTYIAFFKEVAFKSLDMVVDWQRVGFVHGVMNTDNLSILGLTIDFGPYGWLEDYDPGWTPNTTDAENKRYRFDNQPSIVLWNLTQLANALYPLIEDVKALESVLEEFRDEYPKRYQQMMHEKLGLSEQTIEDAAFIQHLVQSLYKAKVDMTLFFRNLADFDPNRPLDFINQIQNDSYLSPNDFQDTSFQWKNWLQHYAVRLLSENVDPIARKAQMNATNPKYVLRNYMAQLAIDAADKEDYSVLNELAELLKDPYSDQPTMEKWFAKRPSWADHKVGCSMLSCSS